LAEELKKQGFRFDASGRRLLPPSQQQQFAITATQAGAIHGNVRHSDSDEVAAKHTSHFALTSRKKHHAKKIWKLKQQWCITPAGHLIRTVLRRQDAHFCGYCTCVRKPSI